MRFTQPAVCGGLILFATSVVFLAVGCASDSGTTGGTGGLAAGGGSTSNGGRSASAGAFGAGGSTVGPGGSAHGGSPGAGATGVGLGGSSGGTGGGGGLSAGGASGNSGVAGTGSGSAPDLPCDIYGKAGTACVAAHSTTRALFAAYSGKLYQVKRTSDNTTLDIGALTAGGYADSAAQDAFCANTTCAITEIYDQSRMANDLGISPGGGAVGSEDFGAIASALPAMAGGHKVYGVYVSPGTGYRDLSAKGTAENGEPEGMYMVTSSQNVNNGCCFDYGNTEQPLANDTGNGHMDAVYFGMRCEHPPCSGSGPWVAADLENGLFQGNGSNTNDSPINYDLVTAMLKNDGQTKFALKTGNAQSGALTAQYEGTLPTSGGYLPMKQEGGIVLGVGGDNSNGSSGDFFEGVMTAGYPTDAAELAVQANIVSVGYAVPTRTPVVPTSEAAGRGWKYTTGTPGASWNQTSFDDSGWQSGNGGFGTSGTPGAVIGTTWNTSDIWLRQSFSANNVTAAELSNLVLRLHHDEDAEVYVNGVLATSLTGYTVGYSDTSMAPAAESAIQPDGTNVLAVHCHNTIGGQYIDAGIYLLQL
jgi:Alpha-L-arabinofuranosidase B, catalytic